MRYSLTKEADRDIQDIYDFSYYKFGGAQADYLSRLLDSLTNLTKYPQLGKRRDELSSNLRSFIMESHIVFYEQLDDEVLIVRILHHSRDAENYFQ